MKIAVAIPCYKERNNILAVLKTIDDSVSAIYVVDDKCPQTTGLFVQEMCSDPRVKVLFHQENKGVGGAVVTAYRQALQDNCDIVVKIDGDGQMNPKLIKFFVEPILQGKADYVKGNRFYSLATIKSMPPIRQFGNASLSFINKLSSGYWNTMDPTNGFTAIHRSALSILELDKLAKDYFFESDMLFRLSTIRAMVYEIPMDSVYENEQSSLSIKKVLLSFPHRYLTAFCKRILYNYYIRDFNVASIELPAALFLLSFGSCFGGYQWIKSMLNNEIATTGTVMIAVLPIILGFQLLLSSIHYDVNNLPTIAISSLFKVSGNEQNNHDDSDQLNKNISA